MAPTPDSLPKILVASIPGLPAVREVAAVQGRGVIGTLALPGNVDTIDE
jgi:hypothetical protein